MLTVKRMTYTGWCVKTKTKVEKTSERIYEGWYGEDSDDNRTHFGTDCPLQTAAGVLERAADALSAAATKGDDPMNLPTVRASLTKADVLEILSLEGTMPHHKIAERFGVYRSTVANVLSGRTWWKITGRRYANRNRKLGKPIKATDSALRDCEVGK